MSDIDHRLMRLRVELYTAAQALKGDDLKSFTDLIREIAMVLDIVRIPQAALSKESE